MIRAALVLALLTSAPVEAQDRSECADTFSARLAAARAALEAPNGAEAVARALERGRYTPAPENVACAAEDELHRISLVFSRELLAVQMQEVLCYGSTRESCTSARATLDEYYRARRARARRPTTSD